jgi:hypothetical protein
LQAVTLAQPLLDGNGATQCLHSARELGEETVPHHLENATLELHHQRVDHIAPGYPQSRQRAGLVGCDHPRVAHDISRQDRRQPPIARLRAHACSSTATLRGET